MTTPSPDHPAGAMCAVCGVPLPTEAAALEHLNEALTLERVRAVTNRCDDTTHPIGVHRHGWARFDRFTDADRHSWR